MSVIKVKSNLTSFATQSAQTAAAATMGKAMQALEALSSEFVKMKIISYKLQVAQDGTASFIDRKEMKVTVNPASYTRAFSSHSSGGGTGKKRRRRRRKKDVNGKTVPSKVIEFTETLSFDLWFDGTGAIPDSDPVADQLKKLKELLVYYDGSIHSTRYVKILWGDLDYNGLPGFIGQLTSLSIDYQYFSRDGLPLRAKATLAFSEIVDSNLKAKVQNEQSPDLTHSRIVKAGDTLPLLCFQIYDDPAYYLQVAAANGLAHFTDLKPGQRIYFPPLEK